MYILSLNQESTNYTKAVIPSTKNFAILVAAVTAISMVSYVPRVRAQGHDGNVLNVAVRKAEPAVEATIAPLADIAPTVATLNQTASQPLTELPVAAAPKPVRERPSARHTATNRLGNQSIRTSAAAPVDGTSYPWAHAAYPSQSLDPWGMYKRECVSYAAWKVDASGRHMPYWGGKGSARLWDDNARAAGIPVDTTPRAGDVAVKNTGAGHVMYVEAVHGDGTITVSDYNNAGTGRYDKRTRSAAGLVFIHF